MTFPIFFQVSAFSVIEFESEGSGTYKHRFGLTYPWSFTATQTKAFCPDYPEIDQTEARAILGGVNPMVEAPSKMEVK